jgi:hypothetical protein
VLSVEKNTSTSTETTLRSHKTDMKPTNNSSGSSSQERLLPVANRTESFWLTERDPLLQNAQTTKSLPRTADVVIVGSGLTGAMMSHHLYADARIQGRKPSMVMLEAGEVCGSATARNGESRTTPG